MKQKKLGSLKNQRGDSMITVAIAAALIGLAAAATGGIVRMMQKEAIFSDLNGASLAVESSILIHLQDPEFYTPEATAKMRQGGSNVLNGLEVIDKNSVIARFGSNSNLDASGKACSSKAEECAMTSKIQMDCEGGVTCRVAYQISINPKFGKRSAEDDKPTNALPPLGLNHWPPVAGSADFSIVISYDLYRREDGKNVCAPSELFVTGMNRSNGNVHCVLPAQKVIAKNQIGRTVAYSSATRSLEIVPRTLSKLTCPDKYVLRIANPASLDEGRTPEGTCVYRYKKEVPWMDEWPRGQSSVQGPFCPQEDYGVVPNGDCTVNVISQTDGVCPRTCCDEEGSCSDCSYTVPPNISYTVSKNFDTKGPNVSCSLVKTGEQQCGADWEGEVVWGGTCKIYVPEHQSAGGSQ